MSAIYPTLGEFFAYQTLPQDAMVRAEAGETVSALRAKLAVDAKDIGWPAALNEIARSTADLLDMAVPEILVAAWNKYRFLRKYLDKDKYPPGETLLVPLAEHTVKSEHHPYLEILLGGQPIGKLTFTVSVALTLKGLTLKIRDGKIKAILTGSCEGQGVLKCEQIVIVEKQRALFSLPGEIDLGEGISIA